MVSEIEMFYSYDGFYSYLGYLLINKNGLLFLKFGYLAYRILVPWSVDQNHDPALEAQIITDPKEIPKWIFLGKWIC